MDELLKDTDVISHTMHDPTKPVKEKECARHEDIGRELGVCMHE